MSGRVEDSCWSKQTASVTETQSGQYVLRNSSCGVAFMAGMPGLRQQAVLPRLACNLDVARLLDTRQKGGDEGIPVNPGR